MVTKSLVEVPFSVHGLIFIESVRGPSRSEEFINYLFLTVCDQLVRSQWVCSTTANRIWKKTSDQDTI